MKEFGLDEWFNLPPSARKRMRLGRKKGRTGRKCPVRKAFTADELIAYLHKTGFRTEGQIRRGRSAENGDPTDHEYRKEFGSFKAARKIAFPEPFTFDRDDERDVGHKIMTAVVYYELTTVAQYKEHCSKNPHSTPNMYLVKRTFYLWSNVMALRSKQDLGPVVADYKKLIMKNGGKPPAVGTAAAAGVYIQGSIDRLFGGSKKEFDNFIMGNKS